MFIRGVAAVAVLARDTILDFAHRNFSERLYREFLQLLQLHEHNDPVIRGDADNKLMPYIEILHRRLDSLN